MNPRREEAKVINEKHLNHLGVREKAKSLASMLNIFSNQLVEAAVYTEVVSNK